MVKSMNIFFVMFVVAIFIAIAAVLGLMGVKNGNHSFIEIDGIAKVQLVADSDQNIVNVIGANKEGGLVLANDTWIGLKTEEAVKKVIDTNAKLGYIDVEKSDNVIGLSVVSGLTHTLDIITFKAITQALNQNQIIAVVVDSEKTVDYQKQAKQLGVCVDKLKLMQAVNNLNNEDLTNLKMLTESELINKLQLESAAVSVKNKEVSIAAIKQEQINLNYAKVAYHKENFIKESQFSENFRLNYFKNIKNVETNYYKVQQLALANYQNLNYM